MWSIAATFATVGIVTFAGLSAVRPQTTFRTDCWPPGAEACGSILELHDLRVILPFRIAQSGTGVPATLEIPPGAAASRIVFNFGDGTPEINGTSPTASHVYESGGVYLVTVRALIGSTWHDNLDHIVELQITASGRALVTGKAPSVEGKVIANGSPVPSVDPSPILSVGENVTVQGSYLSPPTDAQYSGQAPSLESSADAAPAVLSATNVSVESTFQFPIPGTFQIRLVAAGASGGSDLAYNNFTWTAVVAPPGVHAGLASGEAGTSPHPDLLSVYEYTPGGTPSIDPAINYDNTGEETVANVDEALIHYNGSFVGPTASSYVPQLAACVPGSAQCAMKFGSTLVRGDNYTFVLDAAAQFYDPSTAEHWGVYPTDVLFSLARSLAFSDLPCVTCNPGWIIGQALLPAGNASWDGGLHSPYNNTPAAVYQHITVNGSDCPPAATTDPAYHGCVTLWADGAGHSWPFFLELITDPQSAAIVPCGWYSAPTQAAGIPYWTYGNVSGAGDHPCAEPGHGTGTATPPGTGWDHWQVVGSTNPGWGNVEFANVGSGPYYVAQYNPGTSYLLRANPAYGAPSGCLGVGCPSPLGAFVPSVDTIYEQSETPGEEALLSGVADFASIPSVETPLYLSFASSGKAAAVAFPTFTLGLFPFNFNFTVAGATTLTSNPVTVPGDFLSHIAVREFLARSYPYDSVQSNINVRDGIVYAFKEGGAIPEFLGGFYPSNVSWPSTDPCRDANNSSCPAYWLHAGTTSGSPYFDPELVACTAASPCEFPVSVPSEFPLAGDTLDLWSQQVTKLSGGAVQLDRVDLTLGLESALGFLGPGQDPLPIYGSGIAPDYADPTDFLGILYLNDYADAFTQQMSLPAFNSPSCHAGSDLRWWAATAHALGVPDTCQGPATSAMFALIEMAGAETDLGRRTLLYNWAEQIANALTIYIYAEQFNWVEYFAPWIDASSVNTNPMIGGSGQQLWFDIQGSGLP